MPAAGRPALGPMRNATVALLLVCVLGLLVLLSGESGRGGAVASRAADAGGPESTEQGIPRAAPLAEGVVPPVEQRTSVAEGLAAEAPPEEPEPEPTGPDLAFLTVRVVETEGGVEREGVRVLVRPDPAEPGLELRLGPAIYGRVYDGLLTAEAGLVTFELPPGEPFVLSAWDEASGEGARRLEVAPLARGEARELVLVWQQELTRLGGMLVERDTFRPLQELRGEAKIALAQRGREVATAALGARADFQFRFRVDLQSLYVRVDAAGWTPALRCVQGGEHITIAMRRSARLEVRVVDRRGVVVPRCDLEVSVDPGYLLQQDVDRGSFEPAWEEIAVRARTGDEGVAQFASVPSEVPLTVRVVGPPQVVTRDLVLGEDAEGRLEVVLVGPGAVHGRLVDRRGVPIAGKELWYFPGGRAEAAWIDCPGPEPVPNVVTAADGTFQLSLAQGAWLVGPAPACPPWKMFPGSVNPEELARVARRAWVNAGETSELELVADRRLYVGGRVVDDFNRPVYGAQVWITHAVFGFTVHTESAADGGFRIGPLARGPYRLEAFRDADMLGCEPSTVTGGDEEIELVLREEGATLSGLTRYQGTELPVPGAVVAVRGGAVVAGALVDPTTGLFELRDVPPGDLGLELHPRVLQVPTRPADREEFARRWPRFNAPLIGPALPVHLPTRGSLSGLVLIAPSTAWLSVRSRDLVERAEVWQLGARILSLVRCRNEFRIPVPVGPVEVRFVFSSGREDVRQVDLDPEELGELEL